MFSEDFLWSVLKSALAKGGDYADIFLEETAETVIVFNDGKSDAVISGTIRGAGIRVIDGRDFVYLYATDPDEAGLRGLADDCAAARQASRHGVVADTSATSGRSLHSYRLPPDAVDVAEKVAMVRRADTAARGYSPAIRQVVLNYEDRDQRVVIATSEGRFVKDRRVRTRLKATAVAYRGDQKESGFYGPGKSLGFEFFDRFPPEAIAHEAARIAVVMLDADYAPSGRLPVVIGNGFGGVIFHEACGHALEATAVADEASVFCGKLGHTIASPVVSAVDDGTIPNEWGSAAYDDDGLETRKNQLIKNGVLKSYLVDRLGQAKMGVPANGCGRRESYRFPPTSRMSNTYIEKGDKPLADLIAAVDRGLYCRNLGGGSVDPPTTDFNFAVHEAYLIENGKLTRPVKNATLIGKGAEILKNIDMVGDDMEFGTGMCGSISGSIPANVGQPAILVHGLVIGGRG